MAEIFALVVVYNTACSDSVTCRRLAAMSQKMQVLIYDNSTRDYKNRAFCAERDWIYLGGQGNRGLSVAYNACIDALREQIDDGYVCLFDDDTQVDEEYFRVLRRAIASEPRAKILVPRVYSQGRLMSPCHKTGLRISCFDSESELYAAPREELTAINSCMAISLDLFRTYRYDEGIFLDGIDHYFLDDMRRGGQRLYLLDYACDHAFSGMERPPRESAEQRFEIFARDQAYILRKRRLAYCYVVGKRALKLSVQYKDTYFIKVFFQELKYD